MILCGVGIAGQNNSANYSEARSRKRTHRPSRSWHDFTGLAEGGIERAV